MSNHTLSDWFWGVSFDLHGKACKMRVDEDRNVIAIAKQLSCLNSKDPDRTVGFIYSNGGNSPTYNIQDEDFNILMLKIDIKLSELGYTFNKIGV